MEATNVLQSKADIDKEHKAVRALSEAADCSSSARTSILFDLLSRQDFASTSNPNES